MRDPMEAVLNALDRDAGGVVIVWCPDLGLRDWLVGEVESVADADARPVQVDTVEGALNQPERLALLVPRNEREAVLDLDACRDRLLEPPRRQPVVLFLLRDGDGQRALAESRPSLASWIEGNDADPDQLAEIDPEAERAAFIDATGQSPEAFLAEWRAGQLPNTNVNLGRAYRAMLLETLP
jgi:hypothetical protein